MMTQQSEKRVWIYHKTNEIRHTPKLKNSFTWWCWRSYGLIL